jgi:membrane protein
LLLVSLIVSAVLGVFQKSWGDAFAGMAWLLEIVNAAVSFGVVTLLFGFIYKWLPEPNLQWRDVATGSVFTAALFTVGKVLIGLYLGHSSTVSSFGAAGSLMLVLMWVYYSSQIFLFGAEFTRAYTQRRGSQRTGIAR